MDAMILRQPYIELFILGSEHIVRNLFLKKPFFLLRLFSFIVLPLPFYAQASVDVHTMNIVGAHSDVLKIEACRHRSFSQEVRCGRIQRPLNPQQADGKQIDIDFMILPSQDKNKLSDAVFLLAGGPGQSAIDVASFGEAVLKKLNHRRDLVFVDQRGTGRSASLSCQQLENETEILTTSTILKKIDECKQRLEKLPHGDLRMYSTSIAVQDIEAIRRALHYSSINLVGVSYGTRVGLEYLRQFPKSVRRLVLDGVVRPDMHIPSADAQAALDGLFHDCLLKKKCNEAYPDLATTWQDLLAQNSLSTKIIHPRLGYEIDVLINKETLISLVSKTLYSPNMTSTLPYAISQASKKNYTPLLTLAGAFNQAGPGAINMGMHFSVWCGEAYARPYISSPQNDMEKATVDLYDKVCETWPRAKIPPEFFTISPSPVPVLLLSGGIDPVTPTRHAASVAKALGSQARHIKIDNAGHGLLTQGCVPEVVTRFFNEQENTTALQIDTTCVRQIPRPLTWFPPVIAAKKISIQPTVRPN